MDYVIKKDKILRELEELELDDYFKITDEDEDGILIQGEHTMLNSKCLISFQIDNSVFNRIYYSLGKLHNIGKKDIMIDLLNSLNEKNVMLKFFIDKNNEIVASVIYITDDENFDANLYIELAIRAYQRIKDDYYSKIMRVMWG